MNIFRLSKDKLDVLKQAFKEFRYPFLFATLWVCFNLYADHKKQIDLDVVKISSTFFASFFFVSWGFAQYFRIRKQNKVESSFEQIQSKTTEIINRLETATTELVGNITGGDSLVYLQVNVEGTSIFLHHGKYLIHETSVRICDLEKFNQLSKAGMLSYPSSADKFLKIPELLPQHCFSGPNFDLRNKNNFDLNIFYTSRNGAFTQQLRMLRVNGAWVYATNVSNLHGKELFFEASPQFPLNALGQVDWNPIPEKL